MIDYEVNSTTALGAKNRGSIYLRGVKSGEYDSFKFVVEKSVDFHDVDVQLILRAYEEAFKPKMKPLGVGSSQEGVNTSQWKNKQQNKAPSSSGFLPGGQTQGSGEEASDPTSVLEKHGCTVFAPGT